MRIGDIASPTILIGQEGCSACNSAKSYFEEQNIPYIYSDLSDVPSKTGRELALCRKRNNIDKINVPIMIHNEQMYIGFKREEYDEIFNERSVAV